MAHPHVPPRPNGGPDCARPALVAPATLRKRMTNVQILQQAVLLKFKSFYAFLLEHAPDKAAEVLEAYNTTMSSIFLRHFRAHVADLAKCRHE